MEQKDNKIHAQKVVHLQIESAHSYYGSIKAMVDAVGEETLGISERKMRDMRISSFPEYTTPTGAIIRIGRLITTGKRANSQPKTQD